MFQLPESCIHIRDIVKCSFSRVFSMLTRTNVRSRLKNTDGESARLYRRRLPRHERWEENRMYINNSDIYIYSYLQENRMRLFILFYILYKDWYYRERKRKREKGAKALLGMLVVVGSQSVLSQQRVGTIISVWPRLSRYTKKHDLATMHEHAITYEPYVHVCVSSWIGEFTFKGDRSKWAYLKNFINIFFHSRIFQDINRVRITRSFEPEPR